MARFHRLYTKTGKAYRSYLVEDPDPRTQRGINCGHARVSKKYWSSQGGLSNPRLFRKMVGRAWTYWVSS